MLRSVKDIIHYPVQAKDGAIGKAKDCLFDDNQWTCRHLVVDTGNWLPGKKVLISPVHMLKPEVGLTKHKIPVSLSKQQIEECPDLDEDAPVSRQYETELAEHYKLQPYWLIGDFFDASHEKIPAADSDPNLSPEEIKERKSRLREIESSHLRSANEVIGYKIDARDGEFGFVEDLIMEDETWKILFLVVSTRKWLPGRKFLVDVNWIQTFDWENNEAIAGLTRDSIESSPEYDAKKPINRDYLDNLYDFYGMPRHGVDLPLQVPPL
ncbi:MAG: PRC-barrel domain containing protein [Verrucomicrobiae bacterium]|nr:PRC-barrel domain containing protein [Verrucomicrobiae bacterium]